MILAIDIGNSHSVLALFSDEGRMVHHWRFATIVTRTVDDWTVQLKMAFDGEGYALSSVTGVALASVVPQVTHCWRRVSHQLFAIEPLCVDGTLSVLPQMELEHPESVGGDRIANAAAAAALYDLPALIIDFGTATTFDVINGDGAYLGGVIAPGPLLSLDALIKAAAQLSDIPLEFPPATIGRNTSHAMQAGLMWGYLALLEGLIRAIDAEVEGKLSVIATGGLASLFASRTQLIDDYHEHVTLYGIYQLYCLNDHNVH